MSEPDPKLQADLQRLLRKHGLDAGLLIFPSDKGIELYLSAHPESKWVNFVTGMARAIFSLPFCPGCGGLHNTDEKPLGVSIH